MTAGGHNIMSAPNKQDFENAILQLFNKYQDEGHSFIEIVSEDVHRKVGGYPESNHRMPICCNVMRNMMDEDDVVLYAPPSGMGASLKIKYYLPKEKTN